MEPRTEALLKELVTCPELNWVIGPGKAVAEGKTDPATVKLSIKDSWATVEMAEWHCHLALAEIAQLKFVESEISKGKPSRSVHFVNAVGDSLIRVYFSKLVDEAGAVDAEKLARFEALRTKFHSEGGSAPLPTPPPTIARAKPALKRDEDTR